ncbi:helix-turn-helix domain-containing protein [Gilliamella sp. B3464]|nr:helix-turn-helix domain-containing protein [Gilliamella sp. B3468]MCX8750727.1 helix-turn-helix domain-containing protein [Gilliamella sp. B3464]
MNLNQIIEENKINILNFNEFECCIANALDIPLQTLWPSRYFYNHDN